MNPWTVREETILRDLFPVTPTKKCIVALPGRSVAAIAEKAMRLGLRKTVNYMASKCVPSPFTTSSSHKEET